MNSISPKQTVRIKTGETTLEGFAVIPNTGQITPDGISIKPDESGRYLCVEELKLHLEDRRALMVYSLKALECRPVIIDETWMGVGIF